MIRYARDTDFDAVVALWKRCFPGDDAFRDWFFATCYTPSRTLVDEEDGALCAMTQMLPYRLRDARGVRPATYIYGACTAPEYRRQHRMERLLRYSFELDIQRGRAASVLIPQEEWLFGFYAAFGYQPAFFTKTETLERAEKSVELPPVRRLTARDIPALDAAYAAAAGESRLLRSEADWRAQLAMFDALGLGAFGCETDGALSYAFVWADGADGLWAQECVGAQRKTLAQALLQQTGKKQIRLTGAGSAERLGCIRYHDDTTIQQGYFNLLFN